MHSRIKAAVDSIGHIIASDRFGRSLAVSMESQTAVMNLKHESTVNTLDLIESIRKGVQRFYDFSLQYRDGRIDGFISDIRELDQITQVSEKTFVDEIRWSDDRQKIDVLRKPVSAAYLAIFGQDDQSVKVVDGDFWKCLDLHELRSEIYRSPKCQTVSTLFTRTNSFDEVNRLLKLISTIRLECMEMTASYEQVIDTLINRIGNGSELPNTDRIRFDQSDCVVLGNPIGTTITRTINHYWYSRKIETTIGSLAGDVQLLLKDPLEMCSPEHSDDPKGVENLFLFAKQDNVADNIRALQREFISIVEQIELSAIRLDKSFAKISEVVLDTGKPNLTSDLFLFVEIYVRTLATLLKFIMEIAVMLEESYTQIGELTSQVRTLKNYIRDYTGKRLQWKTM